MQHFRQNWGSLLVLVLALGWIWVSRAPQGATTAGKIPAPQVGFLAPAFSLETPDGQKIALDELRGKVVLVNVWATWCPPCRAEMPAMQQVYQEYQSQGFEILAVNSTVQDTLSNLAPFVSEYGLSFPILLDRQGEVTRLYRVLSLPTSFFIGKDGVIREVVVGGPMDEALLRARIEKLLQEQP
ncbi:MAG: TlpA family protein disulfide reductase [Chloroflexi bacterium HGW-Chloroflexi-6]|nr:MAG: TlpA family protein disulfide reductase [Chloroflexi bacterium HGW-Chloroflexi-6]